jgi:hypothetical protein
MQYFYENDLFLVHTDFSDVANNVIRLTQTHSAVTFQIGPHFLTNTDLFNISRNYHNHSLLQDFIRKADPSYNIRDCFDWETISQTTTNIQFLRDNFDCIRWSHLSMNPNALELLQENLDLIDWDELSSNPGAIYIIEQHFHKINVEQLCSNHNAIHLLKNCHPSYFNFYNLARNINAFPIIIANLGYIIDNKALSPTYRSSYHDLAYLWNLLAAHPTEEAVEFISENMWEGINNYGVQSLWLDGNQSLRKHIWSALSGNNYAVQFLEKHKEYIDWNQLCYNTNAIHLLEEQILIHPDSCSWELIKMNPNAGSLVTKYMVQRVGAFEKQLTGISSTHAKWAMDLVETGFNRAMATTGSIETLGITWTSQHGIGWYMISHNPSADRIHDKYPQHLNRSSYLQSINISTKKYVYNYSHMRALKWDLHEQLIAYTHHPRNLLKLVEHFGFDELKEFIDTNTHPSNWVDII